MVRHDGDDDLGAWSEFGTVTAMVAGRLGEDLGSDVQTGFGDRPDLDGLPEAGLGGAGLGEAGLGASAAGVATELAAELAPPKGYDNEVDADGDGTHDEATYRGRADGGVDILVDVNEDGRVDFVGTDTDLDNRVDYADYDKDRDGVFEKRLIDDDGDGFLDRAVWLHEGS
ncbi:hypothetical protein [Actinoplanes solisilvae]|uniref:hypothetical protein n=1 Tax=Actinoplanes solisilvae TaxID=2486853 RepID=UPI000FD8E2A4|nr:hypothetical protein [Actinoplanes solisilvae]